MDKFWENYITTRPVDSKGAFDAFKQMNKDPRSTIPGPRNMADDGRIGFRYGTSVFDIHTKKEAAFKAYKDYKKSYYNSRQRNPILTFREFLPIYAKENYADGGRAGYNDGQLVTPSVDGSRPGYGGDRFSKKEKLKQNRIYTTHDGKRTLDLTK